MLDEDRGLIEEMAVLARVSQLTTQFLLYLAQSLAFFVYGLGAMGGALLGAGLSPALAVDEAVAAGIGAWAGIVVGVVALRSIPLHDGRDGYRWTLLDLAVFAVSMIAGMVVVGLLVPGSVEVSWLPGLGLSLVGWYLARRGRGPLILLYTGLALLAFSPVAVWQGSWQMAAGYTALVYMAAGVAAIRRALSRLPSG